ncbi:MAG: DUF58 domain-containing protein [Thermodesulfobacteriota bacterium]
MNAEARQTALLLSERLRLCLPERQRSLRAGDLLGARAGGSVEFSEHRDYVFGDDPRNVDWRAFARTDRLMVKLFREEITPQVDIILDRSLSMASDAAKEDMGCFAAQLLFSCGRRRRLLTRLFALSESVVAVSDFEELEKISPLPQEDPVPALRRAPFWGRPGVRIVISDFLFPVEAGELFTVLAGADYTVLVQVLSDFESDPPAMGDMRLREAETDEILDLVLTPKAVATYRQKLSALQSELAARARSAGGVVAVLRGGEGISSAASRLIAGGVLEPVE